MIVGGERRGDALPEVYGGSQSGDDQQGLIAAAELLIAEPQAVDLDVLLAEGIAVLLKKSIIAVFSKLQIRTGCAAERDDKSDKCQERMPSNGCSPPGVHDRFAVSGRHQRGGMILKASGMSRCSRKTCFRLRRHRSSLIEK